MVFPLAAFAKRSITCFCFINYMNVGLLKALKIETTDLFVFSEKQSCFHFEKIVLHFILFSTPGSYILFSRVVIVRMQSIQTLWYYSSKVFKVKYILNSWRLVTITAFAKKQRQTTRKKNKIKQIKSRRDILQENNAFYIYILWIEFKKNVPVYY